MADYVVLFLTRRFGEHRCELECEKVEIVDTETGDHIELVVRDGDVPADAAGGTSLLPATPLPSFLRTPPRSEGLHPETAVLLDDEDPFTLGDG